MYRHLKYKNFEHYVIYNDGRVRNTITNKFINGDVNNCGYHRVSLYNNGEHRRFFKHRLVAEHFIDNPENKKFVNHKDGNKSNNAIDNLEWCTQSENEKHKFAELNAKKTNKAVLVIYPDLREVKFESFKDAYESLRIKQQTFSRYVKCGVGSRRFKDYKFIQM